MKVLVTGSTGLIGTQLVRRLRAEGHDVEGLHRGAREGQGLYWSPSEGEIDPIEGFAAVVHLAGAGIADKRWSDERKRVILESRTKGTRLLCDALAASSSPPSVLLSGSAIGYYGDRGDAVLTEDDSPGDDFLAKLCVAWEGATAAAENAGIRVAHARTGLVLDQNDGLLAKLLMPFKLGVGGRMGSGDQWWSWISMTDQLRAMQHLLTSDLSGPVNLTAPNPVTNAAFADALGNVLKRPTILPTPAFALNAMLGAELAKALAFTSARVLPRRLLDDGFEFSHETVEAGLRSEV